MNKKIKFIFIATFLTINCTPLFAADDDVGKKKMAEDANGNIKKIADDDKGIFTFIFENDVFTGTDLGYSNGFRISYLSSEEEAKKLLKNHSTYLPLLNKDGKKRISFALGQTIYTPGDIKKSEFIKNDFFYAGWLYGTVGIVSDTGKIYENSALTFGMVGPSARAEQTQKLIHHMIGASHPQGWNNQLKDEPGINLSYERKWREVLEAKPFGIGVDVIPHIGGNLGNVSTNAAVGATFRLGYDLHSDYGPPRIRPTLPGSDFFIPTKKISGYLFSTVEMRAVKRNIFIDGNSFEGGPGLNKKTFVKSLQIGATLTYHDLRLSYTQVYVTKEFKGQRNGGTEFGSISRSYRF